MSNIFERLLKITEFKGFNSLNDFAVNGLGYRSSEKLNRLKDPEKRPSFDIVEDISNKFEDINIRWFVTGVGSMVNTNTTLEKSASIYKLKSDKINNGNQVIPLYDIEAVAGLVPLFQDCENLNPIDHISIPNLPKCDGAIKITGDSMYPLLKSGDIIMYKQIHDIINDIFYGEMYLMSLSTNDEEFITVKYIQRSEKGEDWVKLVSQNQNHQDRHILRSRIKALALVKASIRINSMS